MITEFITGPAGVGKTQMLRERIEANPSYGILCSTTGISAINLNAKTINAVLGYFDTESLADAAVHGRLHKRLNQIAQTYKNIAIDEISMMDADQFDIIYDAVLESNRHTGKEMGIVITGDFAQLPPIDATWVFNARCWPAFQENITKLDKIWRQENEKFLQAIQLVRVGKGEAAAEILEEFDVFENSLDLNFEGTTIHAQNDSVDNFNRIRLNRLEGEEFTIESFRWGKKSGEWKRIEPKTRLKKGAYVMILSNDQPDFTYANGDCGHVTDWGKDYVCVKLVRNDQIVQVNRICRENTSYSIPRGISLSERSQIKKNQQGKYIIGSIGYIPIRLAYASTVHKCLNPDTYIHSDKGSIAIKNLHVGDSVWTGKTFSKVKAVAHTRKQAFRIKTERGYEITSSADHLFMTKDGGFKAAIDLANTDIVMLGSGLTMGKSVEIELDWLLGLLVGDGSYRDKRDGTIAICCHDEELIQRARDYLRQKDIKLHDRKDGRGAYFISKRFRQRLIDEFDLGYDYSFEKRIPKAIFESARINRCAFLQGLFDADGSVNTKTIVYTSSSLGLAADVQQLLLGVGILSTKSTYYPKNNRPYAQIRISRTFHPKFAREIGFSQRKKKAILNSLPKPKANCAARLSRFEDRIKSVTDISLVMPMVDIELEAEHIYVADGFITHNSQGLTLDKVQIDIRGRFMGAENMVYVALSRARSPHSLRIIGDKDLFIKRVKVAGDIEQWL